MAKGFIASAETSTRNKPRYELLSAAAVANAIFAAKEATLSDRERFVLRCIRDGRRASRRDFKIVASLESKGLVHHYAGTTVALKPPAAEEADPIWLPNTLVTGSSEGEQPPVWRLRSAGDIWALRLLVDLYYAHNLRDDGGISPGVIRQTFERTMVGEHGIFNVWGFKAGGPTLWWKLPFEAHRERPKEADKDHPIWATIQHLQREGLLSFVPHLWDNDSDEAEIIHGYGIGNAGEQLEFEMASAAHRAALAMIPDFKAEKATRGGYYYFAPVLNTRPNVQMIGVARLRYRPHTSRTGDWYGELLKNGPVWVDRYREYTENAARKIA